MRIEAELARTRRQLADLEAELENAYGERLIDAHRRAIAHADELLICAVTLADLGETGRDELDIALDLVRLRAEEHGILRHRPPRPVS